MFLLVLPTSVQARVLTMQFFTYTQMRLPEQDVFIESAVSPGNVVRFKADDAATAVGKQLFALAAPRADDILNMNQNQMGPFAKGKSLGLTVGEWIAASGSGTYDDTSEKPSFSLTFRNLIPNALYTVWCSRLTLPMGTTTGSRPCGPMDWTNDTFRTDGEGNGTVYTPLPLPFPASTDREVTVISIVYESDGQTHQNTNDFGVRSHTQLTYFLPSFESAKQITDQRSGVSGWKWLGFLGLLVFIVFVFMRKEKL